MSRVRNSRVQGYIILLRLPFLDRLTAYFVYSVLQDFADLIFAKQSRDLSDGMRNPPRRDSTATRAARMVRASSGNSNPFGTRLISRSTGSS